MKGCSRFQNMFRAQYLCCYEEILQSILNIINLQVQQSAILQHLKNEIKKDIQ